MPESKSRRVPDARPPRVDKPQPVGSSPRWFAPLMVGLFLFGLLWIVVWYLAGSTLPVMKDLSTWNLAIGFTFIIGGFVMSTRWR